MGATKSLSIEDVKSDNIFGKLADDNRCVRMRLPYIFE
jgi:hypothetical protein